MSKSSTHAAETPPRVHRSVRLNYLVRVVTYPLYLLLYGVHVWPRGVSPWVWALFIWHLLLWPHAARFIATRSIDSKAAELRNLMADSFFMGVAVPFTGFSLWPSAAGFLGIHAGNIINGGVKLAARGVVVFIAGMLAATALVGWQPDLTAGSLLTQMLSVAILIAFSSVFSYVSYRQAQD
ncbi:MAG TPA: MASE2 domain-containing protein, partial [Aeromicrobium sp.]|nr:MASE2 domain-containing protein [Aeromicrobium sp.]